MIAHFHVQQASQIRKANFLNEVITHDKPAKNPRPICGSVVGQSNAYLKRMERDIRECNAGIATCVAVYMQNEVLGNCLVNAETKKCTQGVY